MKRKHIKNFQSEQYKKADERIHKAAFIACMTLTSLDYYYAKFRRYQLI